jgi:sulfite reductase alpha subunit-like flavoprotein
MKNDTHKDLVPFTNSRPLVPGKGGGLRHWKLERDKQQLKDEIGDLAKVMRRLSQELIEDLLFLKDPNTLKANIAKATETLVKHLDSEHENISLRAAERIIEFAQKALSNEELERRIEALEARLMQQGGNYR